MSFASVSASQPDKVNYHVKLQQNWQYPDFSSFKVSYHVKLLQNCQFPDFSSFKVSYHVKLRRKIASTQIFFFFNETVSRDFRPLVFHQPTSPSSIRAPALERFFLSFSFSNLELTPQCKPHSMKNFH